jgi:hypothetical protein
MTRYIIRDGKRIAVEELETDVKPKKRKSKSFGKVPLMWGSKAAKALKTPRALILALLMHSAWRAKGEPFTFSNVALKKYGVSRWVKGRALAILEAAGLIKVEHQPGQSPTVTIIDVGD